MSGTTEFSYRAARSPALAWGFGAVIVIETVALHFLLRPRLPMLAWVLTLASAWALWWIVADFRAMGTGRIALDGVGVHLRVGRRWSVDLARADIESVIAPTFRDLPQMGSLDAATYANLMKPAQPNVLITLTRPVSLRGPAGIRRSATRIGMHVDDAPAFLVQLGPAS